MGLLRATFFLLAISFASLAIAQSPTEGTVSQAIALLKDQGISVNFSTNLLRGRESFVLPADLSKSSLLQSLEIWLAERRLDLTAINPTLFVITLSEEKLDLPQVVGRVIDHDSGLPIQGARVHLGNRLTITAEDGNFSGKMDKAGVAISVEAPGYQRTDRYVEVDFNQPLLISLVPQLENIVITGSQHDLMAIYGLNKHYIADADELSTIPAIGGDRMRAITQLPGNTGDGISAKPYVRGGRPDEVLVRLDGVTLLEPYHFRDFQSLFSVVDSSVLDRAVFHTGGFQVDYGNRLSGVLDMHTLDFFNDQWYELNLSLFASSLSFVQPDEKLQNRWLGWIKKSNLDWVSTALEQDKIEPPALYDGYIRYDHRFDDSLTLTFSLLNYREEIEASDINDYVAAQSRYDNLYSWVEVKKEWDSVSSISRLVNAAINRRRRGHLDRAGVLDSLVDDSRDHILWEFDQSVDIVLNPEHKFSIGFGSKTSRADYNYSRVGQFDPLYLSLVNTFQANNLPSENLDINIEKTNQHNYFFAMDRYKLTADWIADVGIRFDEQEYSSQPNDFQTSLRVNLLYFLRKNTSIHFALGRYSQAQEINELKIEDGQQDFYPAQSAYQFVAGIDHHYSSKLRLGAELYYKQFDNQFPEFVNLVDRIEFIPEVLPDSISIQSERGRATGIELTAKALLVGDLETWLNYTYAKAVDYLDSGKQPRDWDQRHSMNTGIRGPLGSWNYYLRFSFHSGWPTTNFSITADSGGQRLDFEKRNGKQLKNYYSVDAHIEKIIQAYNHNWNLYFDITNLLGRDNHIGQSFKLTQTGGQAFINRESQGAPGLMANIGVMVRF